MGNFIGDLGGILMIVLIVVLAFRFVWDVIGKKGEDSVVFMKDFTFYAVSAAAVFTAIFTIVGIMYSHAYGATSFFDIETIWNKGMIQNYLTAHTYSLSEFTEKGILPLYPAAVSVLSGLLFDMYVKCGLYISILCGVVTTISLGFILRKKLDREASKEYILLFLCVPGFVFLFLPSSFSLFAALCSLVLLGIEYNKKYLAAICTILCVMTHVYGLAVLAMVIVSFVYKGSYRNFVNASVFFAAVFIFSIFFYVKGFVSIYEMWFVYLLPICMVVPKVKEESGVIKYTSLGLILINSLYMTGFVYNVF